MVPTYWVAISVNQPKAADPQSGGSDAPALLVRGSSLPLPPFSRLLPTLFVAIHVILCYVGTRRAVAMPRTRGVHAFSRSHAHASPDVSDLTGRA